MVNAVARAPQGDARAIESLGQRARDPDLFVRNRAIVSLARVGGAAVEQQVALLSPHVDPAARLVALASVGTESALAAVLDTLADPGVFEQVRAFLEHEARPPAPPSSPRSISKNPTASGPVPGREAMVSQHEQLLRTSLDVTDRRFAVEGLARLSGGRTADVLAEVVVSDPAEAVRLRAARALALHVETEQARLGLCRALADPSPEVALEAARALAGRREPEVARAFARRLGAGAKEVQAAIEAALADIHRDDPEPFLDGHDGLGDRRVAGAGGAGARADGQPAHAAAAAGAGAVEVSGAALRGCARHRRPADPRGRGHPRRDGRGPERAGAGRGARFDHLERRRAPARHRPSPRSLGAGAHAAGHLAGAHQRPGHQERAQGGAGAGARLLGAGARGRAGNDDAEPRRRGPARLRARLAGGDA